MLLKTPAGTFLVTKINGPIQEISESSNFWLVYTPEPSAFCMLIMLFIMICFYFYLEQLFKTIGCG
jgi:hypothetical protein